MEKKILLLIKKILGILSNIEKRAVSHIHFCWEYKVIHYFSIPDHQILINYCLTSPPGFLSGILNLTWPTQFPFPDLFLSSFTI